VMHCAVQLLRMLASLHTARILHTDIKPDNFLVMLNSENEAPSLLDLQLIDFGRAVDLELLPAGCRLQGDCGTDCFRCVEMREGSPWRWQADAYSVAGVLHCLLFGEYMDIERVVSAKGGCAGHALDRQSYRIGKLTASILDDTNAGEYFLRIKAGFKRYWDTELWHEVFDVLLNGANSDAPPEMGRLVQKLEQRLEVREGKVREECKKLVESLACCRYD
jgi:checkpoint serine/threonine-protein kinase